MVPKNIPIITLENIRMIAIHGYLTQAWYSVISIPSFLSFKEFRVRWDWHLLIFIPQSF